MFKITTNWLFAHKTPRGGWTRDQLAAIGVPWPPPHDWMVGVQGAVIDERTRAVFENRAEALPVVKGVVAKPTVYQGIQFRSRLEARWAAFFDRLGWPYEYEPFECGGWIPDFLLKLHTPVLVEVKPAATSRELGDYVRKIDVSTAVHEVLLVGVSPFLDADRCFGLLRDRLWDYGWAEAWHFGCTGMSARQPEHEFGFCSSEGSYECRVCGAWNGDHHIGETGAFVHAKWKLAMNDTQYRSPRSS